MVIVVNGTERTEAAGVTVAELLARLGLAKQACAVEVNRVIVPKAEHGDKRLAEGDRVELVTLVGGG